VSARESSQQVEELQSKLFIKEKMITEKDKLIEDMQMRNKEISKGLVNQVTI